ncbi:MAG: hypothetical protein IJI84_00980 [Clostridia bacterium]|nr:hypothetical protein [Clostridia bacterium]
MKHMKNFTLFGAAFLAALTLGACGKDNNAPQEEPIQTQSELTKPSVSQGENEWPTANFITEDMKYTGKGEIVYTEHIDGKEDGDQDCSWIVFYKDAEINDVKNYIETLKSKGFKYTGEEEPAVEFKNKIFSWEGKSDDTHFVSIFITDHNALTTAGDRQENIEQNMYIRMSNYDLSAAAKNDLPDDMPPKMVE